MNIIGISGKKGSGKDTFAQFLKEELEKQLGKTVKVDSFAANLKQCCAILSGQYSCVFYNQNLKDKKANFLSLTNRELMQKFGDLTRSIDKDIWVKSLFNKYIDNPPEYLIISDVRFSNEAKLLTCFGDYLLIRIQSDRSILDKHISETELDSCLNDFNLEITNNKSESLEQLKNKAKKVVEYIKIVLE